MAADSPNPIKMKNHHAYANLFPMLGDAELATLAKDIKENGQQDPIVLLDGEILDGRNRQRACEIAEVAPMYVNFDGDDPLAFVVSHNLHRRHLTESQRGMVAGKLAQLKDGQRSDRVGVSIDTPKIPSRAEAGKLLNVGESTVSRSRKILAEGSPELVSAVESGEIAVGPAHHVASLPHEEQAELVGKGKQAITDKAKQIAEGKRKAKGTTSPDKPKKAKATFIPFQDSDGEGIVATAISIMDRINPNDKFREYAFNRMIEYCQDKLSQTK